MPQLKTFLNEKLIVRRINFVQIRIGSIGVNFLLKIIQKSSDVA